METYDDPILQPVSKRYPDHQWLVKGAFVTAIATGVGGAVVKIWDMFYDNMKNLPLFADLKSARETDKLNLTTSAQYKPMTHSEFTQAMSKIENTWSTGFNKRLKESLGIESEGLGMIKGTWQRFRSLGNHTQPKIIFGTVFATAAAISGYLLINQNAHMKRDLRTMQDRIEEDRKKQHTTER